MNNVSISGYVKDKPLRYLADNGTEHAHFRIEVVHYTNGERRGELYPVQAWNRAAETAAAMEMDMLVHLDGYLTRNQRGEIEVVATEIYRSFDDKTREDGQ